jgi:8-oxo-dGTP pyrophosphatase MutT (NUDIX family)
VPAETPAPYVRPRTRYQGAILRDGAVLLIQQREHATGHTYWLLPGGGMEAGETPEACVAREMLEETGLTVRVERLLLDVPSTPGGHYMRAHTYLCTPLAGEAAPGYEPEPEISNLYSIIDVRWVPFADESSWDPLIVSDDITSRNLRLISQALSSISTSTTT